MSRAVRYGTTGSRGEGCSLRRRGEPLRTTARDVSYECRHDRNGEHLSEREDPDTDVVGGVEIVVEGAVDPRGPDRVEEEDEPTNPGPRWVLGEAMGELRDDDDEDEVEEQL